MFSNATPIVARRSTNGLNWGEDSGLLQKQVVMPLSEMLNGVLRSIQILSSLPESYTYRYHANTRSINMRTSTVDGLPAQSAFFLMIWLARLSICDMRANSTGWKEVMMVLPNEVRSWMLR